MILKIKKTIFIAFISLFISSCAFHSGMINNSVQINQNNFKYIRKATGQASTIKILGIGGMEQDAIVAEAKNNLLKYYPLKDGQALANIIVDVKYSFLLVFMETTITITADIVEFN